MTDLFNKDATVVDTPESIDYVEYAKTKFVKDGQLDTEALARGKYEADVFVEQLKAEQAELRKELASRISLEKFLEETKTTKAISNTQEPSNTQTQSGTEQQNKGSVSSKPEDMENTVRNILKQETQKATEERNIAHVQAELKKAWGSNYTSKLVAKADELGLGQQFLTKLAAESPKAFLELMGAEAATPISTAGYTPPKNQHRVDPSRAVGVKNKAYYDGLKKADPNSYWSPRIQGEMHREALKQGESFFN